jgi:hypothetical protein
MRAQTPGGRIPVHEFGAARRWAGASGAHCRIWAQCIWSVLAFAMTMTCMRAAGLERALGPPLPAACPPRAALVARWALLRSLSAQSLDTRSWPLALGEATTLVATRARRSEILPAPAHKHLPPPQARAKERSSQAGGAAAAMPVRSRRAAQPLDQPSCFRGVLDFPFPEFPCAINDCRIDRIAPRVAGHLLACLDRHRTKPLCPSSTPLPTPCGKGWRTSVLSCSRMVPTPS